MNGRIHKISISENKGEKKYNIDRAELVDDHGILGDAHAGSGRQVSLLPLESFSKVKNEIVDINPGDFAENITTSGLDLSAAVIGRRLKIGRKARLEVTQIGKTCHHGCYIREIVGDCIMPREGIFARVVKGGPIETGDTIAWMERHV